MAKHHGFFIVLSVLSAACMWPPAHAAGAASRTTATPKAAVAAALKRAGVPLHSASWVVMPASGGAVLSEHGATQSMNPASVMKLVTTYAALDSLGAAYTWKTHFAAYGVLRERTLHGDLLVRGGGDPKLVVERLQPMLQSLRDAGIDRIAGDIVLDKRLYRLPAANPADFDGEPLRPYNATPDALLINFKSVVMTFTPDKAAGVARVDVQPPLAGMAFDTTVPLNASTSCVDWRSALQARIDNPQRLSFAGAYPAACGEQVWPSAYAEPERHSARALQGMWQQVGGQLTGQAREWTDADASKLRRLPVWQQSFESLPLGEVLRDVNKFSNNVMAQHLFLTLGLERQNALAQQDTRQAGRLAMGQWWQSQFPHLPTPQMDNGSGLSRSERMRAIDLAQLLRRASGHPQFGAWFDSLPVAGQDRALRNHSPELAGRAFLKTGTLRDVAAVAGYVDDTQGKRWVVVAIVNHPNAGAARPALDTLLRWVAQR